jgi:transposase
MSSMARGRSKPATAAAAPSPPLTAVPLLPHEPLYVGVDVGKAHHVAGFVCATLLARHERFEACPTLRFANSREGFQALSERLHAYAPLEHIAVLVEHTGHYHRALVQYLQELDLPIYVMPVQQRPKGLLKTDRRDALILANHLYSQLALGVQSADQTHLVRHLLPPSTAAAQLKGWLRHRYELVRECTRRRNKLTAICDELFPELVQVFHDPNRSVALTYRERLPTPHALATAPGTALVALRLATHPSDAQLAKLQGLARDTIGTRDLVRQRGLVLEQAQLIAELRLLQTHLQALDREIVQVVEQTREGGIVLSIPDIGPIQAAAILATIGNIRNFSKASALKAYFGWAPKREQSGISRDAEQHAHTGTRIMKQMFFLIACNAIQRRDGVWRQLYERLLPRLCAYDVRQQTYRGKTKVLVRIAGQMIEMIYAFLIRDAALLDQVPPGQEAPPPLLYDAETHRRHRQGSYRPLKNASLPHPLLHLPVVPVLPQSPDPR